MPAESKKKSLLRRVSVRPYPAREKGALCILAEAAQNVGSCQYWTYVGYEGGPVGAAEVVGAPIADCFAESWIGHLKRECLNTLFCFSLRQLDHVVQTYTHYYNTFRPHQSLDNRPLIARHEPPPVADEIDPATIGCRRFLGGLLNHYYRRAA